MSITKAEAELLHMLMEECGEVIQAASKVLRHGWDSYHPRDLMPDPRHGGWIPKRGAMTNLEALTKELADVYAVAAMMDGDFALIDAEEHEATIVRKLKYTHHQGDKQR